MVVTLGKTSYIEYILYNNILQIFVMKSIMHAHSIFIYHKQVFIENILSNLILRCLLDILYFNYNLLYSCRSAM